MKKLLVLVTSLMMGSLVVAQESENKLDNFYSQTKEARAMFEAPKDTATTFEKVKINIGGGFALQPEGEK